MGKYEEWNEEILKNFSNACFISKEYEDSSSENCTSFLVSQDKSHIISGNSTLKNVNHNSDLSFGLTLVRDGYVNKINFIVR